MRYNYYKTFAGFYSLGWKVGFSSGVTIRKPKFMSIGSNVYLDKDVVLQIADEHTRSSSPKIKIGDKVTIGAGSFIAAAKSIIIKDNVLIGQYVGIYDHDHEYRQINVPIRFQGLRNVKAVIIEDGAWIGAGAVISAGVRVGRNAVIGARSVVTRDIPDYSVAVGAPCKVIKKFSMKKNKWVKVN